MFLVFNSVIMTIFRTQGSTCKDNDIESVEVQVVTEPIAVEEVQQDSISFDDATKHDRYNK